ncbi:MAG: hypothetical protein Kow0073_16960 [Immundisolibacter sp.]
MAISSVTYRWTRTDAIPFDAAHRYMAVLVHDHEGHVRIVVKGAPEAVLALCADQLGADGPPGSWTPIPGTLGSSNWPPRASGCWR